MPPRVLAKMLVPPALAKQTDALDDEDVERVWQDLHRARGELAAHDQGGHDFKVTALGGLWLQRERGLSTDAVQGHAASGRAIQSCRTLKVPLSCKFSFSVYGAEAPAILARGWVARMQHFMGPSSSCSCVFSGGRGVIFIGPRSWRKCLIAPTRLPDSCSVSCPFVC